MKVNINYENKNPYDSTKVQNGDVFVVKDAHSKEISVLTVVRIDEMTCLLVNFEDSNRWDDLDIMNMYVLEVVDYINEGGHFHFVDYIVRKDIESISVNVVK